jgi:uncharacterized membrane protein YgdD (TMEM256/DUF423 family)
LERVFFMIGCISAGIAVAAGAFGAHAFRARLAPEMLTVFETAARYHMFHAFGLLAAAYAAGRWPGAPATWAGIAFLAGTVLFSGSLYALALSGVRALGAITPLGGVAFLLGWGCLAAAAMSR